MPDMSLPPQLSASWQDYLDTSYELQRLYLIFGSALGPHLGIREILESPLSVLAMPLIPAYKLFSERVNTFKPENKILG